MKLKTLLKKVPLTVYAGPKDGEVTGLCENSKRVSPGNLFIARKGSAQDGAKYIEEAISHGATFILTERGNPFIQGVTQLTHPDIPAILGKLASAYYGAPSEELFTVGVTGTNGKTSITYLIRHLLAELGVASGVIGTVEYIIGEKRCSSNMTTPDLISNHKMLREMVRADCQAALLEVSSHGLAQGRVAEIDFDVAIFTNLTQDHLDYHKSMEAYFEAKRRLFLQLKKDRWAILCKESPWVEKMGQGVAAKILTYGFTPDADLYATNLITSSQHSLFEVHYKGEKVQFKWPVIGKHNILNALASIACILVRGYRLRDLVQPLSTFRGAPGRLERVLNSSVFVDFAHTPDALENVLATLQDLKKEGRGKIITVFGCGGDRDQEKRPLMGAIVEKLSDLVIVTSDNPRSEDPLSIIQDILKGFKKNSHLIEVDRASAIQKAIELKETEDLILIAGKGHETYQLLSHQSIPFNDREVAEKFINGRSL